MNTNKTYFLVSEKLNKSEIKDIYGEVSFAYTNKNDDVYNIVAISNDFPQYFKITLLIDKINFYGVDTTIEREIVNEVL